MANHNKDLWTSKEYQDAADFVPKLATKIVQWLNPREGDRILDIGCGDGVLTYDIAQRVGEPGSIDGVDASASMIESARARCSSIPSIKFKVIDATKLSREVPLQWGCYTKVFSNAALHWILRAPETRKAVFEAASDALEPGTGKLCFEMGGMGNVAEVRAALLAAVAKRIGIRKAREADPWFFPDEKWMREMLESCGFEIEKTEMEYRPTRSTTGSVVEWVRLMGKQFLDAVGAEGSAEREDCVKEVADTLSTVCQDQEGWAWFGYVRLRVLARKR